MPQGQGSLALHCTKCSKGRGEGGCSSSTELQELRVTQGECTFFPFLTLPVSEDTEPCIKRSKMQSYSWSVEAQSHKPA